MVVKRKKVGWGEGWESFRKRIYRAGLERLSVIWTMSYSNRVS